jgi:predicted transcriptional regulator
MNSTMNNEMLDPHLTAKIVSSYVRHHTLGADHVSDLITSVHRALSQLGQHVQTQEVLTPAVSVRQSVRHDYVVCLNCGYRGKTLRRHIATRHGLSRDDYLKRWGLKSDHPLTAPSYSEQRSMLAKELGLGRKAAAAVVPAATSPARVSAGADPKSAAKPARRRSTRSASKSADAAKGAAPPSSRKRPPRSRREDNPSPGRADLITALLTTARDGRTLADQHWRGWADTHW